MSRKLTNRQIIVIDSLKKAYDEYTQALIKTERNKTDQLKLRAQLVQHHYDTSDMHFQKVEKPMLYVSAIYDFVLPKTRQCLSSIKDKDNLAMSKAALTKGLKEVFKQKGFSNVVPVFETMPRYEALNKEFDMTKSEEEIAELSTLTWEYESSLVEGPMIPVQKQRITRMIGAEIAEHNARYAGHQIVHVEFNEELLPTQEEVDAALKAVQLECVQSFEDYWGFDAEKSEQQNFQAVKSIMRLFDLILETERDEYKINEAVQEIMLAIGRSHYLLL